ncbi:hypothetical protein [Nonomuraea sp. NPDC003214]
MFNIGNYVGIGTTALISVLLLAGTVLLGMNRRNHGRGATLGMFGCLALFLDSLVRLAQLLMIGVLLESFGPGGIDVVFLLVNLVSFVLMVTGVSLLIAGVIARRTPPQQAGPQAPQQPQHWQQGPQQGPQQGWQQQGPQGPYGQPQGPQPGWQQQPPSGPQGPQPGWQPPADGPA